MTRQQELHVFEAKAERAHVRRQSGHGGFETAVDAKDPR